MHAHVTCIVEGERTGGTKRAVRIKGQIQGEVTSREYGQREVRYSLRGLLGLLQKQGLGRMGNVGSLAHLNMTGHRYS